MITNNDNISSPISAGNVAEAWNEAFGRLMRRGVEDIAPLLVSVHGLENDSPEDHPPIREALDGVLRGLGKNRDTNEVANTIFPRTLWNPAAPRAIFYERFLKNVWPSIRHVQANRRGNYFYRMVRFVDEDGAPDVNQLEHIIETWTQRHNHRHSALQLSIFDPRRDHLHSRRLGFPCLHQVSFTPLGPNGQDGLTVTGYYATQHIVTKAYGNYLGLIRLGQFMAHALGLRLCRMNCFAAKVELGVPKTAVQALCDSLTASDAIRSHS